MRALRIRLVSTPEGRPGADELRQVRITLLEQATPKGQAGGGVMENGLALEALEDMAWQYAYRFSRGRGLFLGTGGMSALEGAFDVLGWEDPHRCKLEMACDVVGCFEWRSAGIHWGDWYVRVCSNHFNLSLISIKPPKLRRTARRLKQESPPK